MVQSPVAMVLLWGYSGVLIYNDAYAEIAGLRHPSMLGGKVCDEWPEVADFNRNVLRNCLAGRTLTYRNQQFTLLRNNVEEQAFFDLYYSPVYNLKGRADGVLAVVMETTQQVRAEDRRDAAERALRESNYALQQANADLEQFAFSASHDLKEPLRMVSVYGQLLKRKLSGKLDTEAELFLRHCVEGAARVDALIKDLLEYTHTSSDVVPDPEPVSVDLVVRQTLEVLGSSIQATGAVVTMDPLPTLKIAGAHLQQIFQHLLTNAIKYRSNRPPKINIGAMHIHQGWIFSVSDNGIGIDQAYREQVFGLFKRLHGVNEYPGTGLGLAICKKLVDRYGGRIWVDSKLGVGSVFCFTLPRAQ